MHQSEVLRIVDQIHQAALEPAQWAPALQSMADAVGAIGSVIVPMDLAAPVPSFRSTALVPFTEYTPEWHARNSRVQRTLRRGLRRGFLDVDAMFTPHEFVRDAFNEEFMVPSLDSRSDVAFLVTPSLTDHVITISALRHHRRGRYSQEQKALWDLFGRHAARSLTIAATLAGGWEPRTATIEVLSRLDCGVAFLDATGRVQHLNAAAKTMLAGGGFSTVGGRLRARIPLDQPALDTLLRSAGSPDTAPGFVGPVHLRRPDGKPVLAHAIGVGADSAERLEVILLGRRSIVVFFVDPDAPGRLMPETVLTRFGLTPAEARLASHVGAGLPISEAAQRLGLTEGSARTIVKRIYAKLGFARQAELVRFVTRLSAIGGSES
ncbi:MAG: helix-turn-helix transcriptional regulator [Bauldia sp.]|nr:helix-turn-helix transcriptional regulator [Bauldia sp.]